MRTLAQGLEVRKTGDIVCHYNVESASAIAYSLFPCPQDQVLTVARRPVGLHERGDSFVHGAVFMVKLLRGCHVLGIGTGVPDGGAECLANGAGDGVLAADAGRIQTGVFGAT